MTKVTKLLPVLLVLIVLVVGCSNQPNIVEPQQSGNLPNPSGLVITATFDSAFFYIYVTQTSNQDVTIHRITAPWTETGVTWNNFGEAFDATVQGTFNASALGWYRINITSLVQSWLDGTYPNYGLLLDQGDLTPFTRYASSDTSETAIRPKFEYFYTDNGVPGSVVVQRGTPADVFDSFIHQLYPDLNFGTAVLMYSGYVNTYEKQALIWGALPTFEQPPTGCTRTIGYWKTHAGFGPQADVVTQYLPIWLGTSGGGSSLLVNTNLIAYNVLSQFTYGSPSNGITKLYAQLLGAKLNIAAGADDADVATVIAAADAFLATHDYTAWAGLSQADKNMVLGWKDTLDNYNNGIIGPGHCDD